MLAPDAHLGERLRGDDDRRDDLHEAGCGERFAKACLELDDLRRAMRGAVVLQALPGGAREILLEGLEGRVARGDVGEHFVQHQSLGAKVTQAL